MKTTNKSVIIETTNTINGMLEQGGICGMKIAYPIDVCERVTGLTAAELAAAKESDSPKGYTEGITLREIIEHAAKGRIISKGVIIK